METALDQQVLLRYEVPGEFLLNELQSVYDHSCSSQRLSCDVRLLGKDQLVVYAHSALLAVVSPYMKLILSESWNANQRAVITLPDFYGADLQNLVQFLYTGKVLLTEAEFEVFQQLICELQITTDGDKAIILEEFSTASQNSSKAVINMKTEDAEEVSLENVLQDKPRSCPRFLQELNHTSFTRSTSSDGLDSLTCSTCTMTFENRNLLSKHKKNQHQEDELLEVDRGNEDGEESASEIIIDEVELILEEDYKPRRSRTGVSGERPFKCPLCDKSYPVKATLTAHLRLHAEDKPHQCEICGKSFLIRSLLEQHLRIHTDERPYVCTVCGKSFRNQSNLIGHKKTHSGDRPHLCNICQKSFNRRHDLDAHLRIHSGEKPYPCSLCNKSFRFRSALRVHLRGVHKT